MTEVKAGIEKALAESGWEAVNLVGSTCLGPAWKILAPTAKALVDFKSPADVAMAALMEEWAAAERQASERAILVQNLIQDIDESQIGARLVLAEELLILNTRARRWQLFTKLHHAAISGLKFGQATHTTDPAVRIDAITSLHYRCSIMGLPAVLADHCSRELAAPDVTVERASALECLLKDWMGVNHTPLCIATWTVGRVSAAAEFGEDYSHAIEEIWKTLQLPPSLSVIAIEATKTAEEVERFCSTLAGHL